jgi:predicted transcriptional regulator
MKKSDEIIQYIKSLGVGNKISVRLIASELGVSEGTAYRAIKEGEKLGIVTTIPRVGTVRIERVDKKTSQMLTYAEIINIVNGTILGGREGIYKTLNKFVIGAMEIEEIEKYISPGGLLIVGNREKAQELALNNESAVLISGGFSCSDRIKKLATSMELPIISSNYDTFTIAEMINRAMSENSIKKDIILVEDIMEAKTQQSLTEEFDEILKDKKNIAVTPKTTISYLAHVMSSEGVNVCPVIKGKKIIGVVTRDNLFRGLEHASRQQQFGETYEELFLKAFESEIKGNRQCFTGTISPLMVGITGTASWSSLNMIMSTIGLSVLRQHTINLSVDSISTYYTQPIQVDNRIEIYCDMIEKGNSFCKLELSMFDKNKKLAAKTIISARLLKSR